MLAFVRKLEINIQRPRLVMSSAYYADLNSPASYAYRAGPSHPSLCSRPNHDCLC